MRLRIDFGRVFPGLLLLLAGLLFLVILVFVAAIVYLFTFLAGMGSLLGIILQLTIVPALLIAVGMVVILTGISGWRSEREGRLRGMAKARAMRDNIRLGERIGEVFGVVISLFVFLFLYANQLRRVPFFTSSFGGEAQFFFYAPLFAGMALSLARIIYGHRNGLRPFDSLNALFLAVASFWLLSVFPFDFTHLGDMFPVSIRLLFWWLTNDIGRVLFALAGLTSLINFVYTAFLYSSVRSQLIAMHGRGNPTY